MLRMLFGSRLVYFAVSYQPPCSLPLRMVAVHERFHYLQLRVLFRSLEQFLTFGCGQADRLFAKYVFAFLQRFDRPGHVQMVGQWIVNSVDLGIGQHFLI